MSRYCCPCGWTGDERDIDKVCPSCGATAANMEAVPTGDDEDDDCEPEEPRPTRDSPGLVRTGADRDREMSYEDYHELTRPEEPLGDNEDI